MICKMAVDGQHHQQFMTKTQHYRKVTKPLLERKRRARMNLYLDELKDLIVDTMEAQGEQITKLEKADILEMTVNYLKTQKHHAIGTNANISSHKMDVDCRGNISGKNGSGGGNGEGNVVVEKYRAGYIQAAYDVSNMFACLPDFDLRLGRQLMQHLGQKLQRDEPKDLNTRKFLDDDGMLGRHTQTEPQTLNNFDAISADRSQANAAQVLDYSRIEISNSRSIPQQREDAQHQHQHNKPEVVWRPW